MADNKPTFHHLNNSQSQRILWLLEELNVDYNIVLHTRNPASHPTAPFRSPPSLIATGPYGKAPLLITGAADGNRYIPETLAIANYIIRTFDTSDKFGLRNGDWIRDDMLTSICMSNLGRATGFMLFLGFGWINSDHPVVADKLDLKAQLSAVQKELVEGPKGGFFMGQTPGRADIMLEFPISSIKHQRWVDLEAEYPELDKWLTRVYELPAWKRGLDKAFDGKYDLGAFKKQERL